MAALTYSAVVQGIVRSWGDGESASRQHEAIAEWRALGSPGLERCTMTIALDGADDVPVEVGTGHS